MAQHKNKARTPVLAEKYFLQQHAISLKSLRTYNRKQDPKTLHQLRVSVKKIKAIMLMLHKLNAGFDYKRSYTPYKKIFKQAGVIRQELLHDAKISDDSRNKLAKPFSRQLMATLNKRLLSLVPSFLKNSETILPTVRMKLRQLESGEIFSYCKKLHKNLSSRWGKSAKNADIHKFRKHLKQLLYCSELLNENDKDKLASAKKYKRINKMQDAIGQWHDNILLLNRISEGDLKVNPIFLQSLHNETKDVLKKIYRHGNKL